MTSYLRFLQASTSLRFSNIFVSMFEIRILSNLNNSTTSLYTYLPSKVRVRTNSLIHLIERMICICSISPGSFYFILTSYEILYYYIQTKRTIRSSFSFRNEQKYPSACDQIDIHPIIKKIVKFRQYEVKKSRIKNR